MKVSQSKTIYTLDQSVSRLMGYTWPRGLRIELFGFGILSMVESNSNLLDILKIFTLLIGQEMENVLFLGVEIKLFESGIPRLGLVERL